MSEKRATDWEAIEREYRAGQLSVREIARQHGVSHVSVGKRAKREGWVQNLAQRVREEVTTRLVTSEVTSPHARDVVDAAAARGVELVRQHRTTLGRLNRVASGLLDALETQLEVATGARSPDDPAAVASLALIGEKETVADVMEKIQRTVAKVIPLERQAFNLDEQADAQAPQSVSVDIDTIQAVIAEFNATYR